MRYFFIAIFFFAASATADNSAQLIRESMDRANLGAKVDFIEPSPMAGLYVVGLQGGRVLYASEDGHFFIQGRLYEAGDGKTINLTDRQEREGIAKAISDIDTSEMIVFKAKDERSVITVFTDTSCPFCHKLHEDIDEINDAGVTIRYLAYPREGLKSETFQKMVSVWCADDRQKAISDAINEDYLVDQTCSNPVESHYMLGQQIGLQGTPSIVFRDGSVVSGYRSAEVIEKMASSIAEKE